MTDSLVLLCLHRALAEIEIILRFPLKPSRYEGAFQNLPIEHLIQVLSLILVSRFLDLPGTAKMSIKGTFWLMVKLNGDFGGIVLEKHTVR